MQEVISVKELVDRIKSKIEDNYDLANIYVKGEVSRVTYQASGHVYFSLKDANSAIDCTLWRSYATKLAFKLEQGQKVVVLGSAGVYALGGRLQFNCKEIIADGIGNLYLALEQLKDKLNKEHLFDEDHKKAIPEYPENIAIISGKSAAGLKDVQTILARRWPMAKVKMYYSLVQGEKASKQIIECLKQADANHHDVILIVRGGGSIEDLWCFNDEELAHTIYDMQTCVVTGIGHEIDFTIAEMVADKRCSTPSAAAEIITPNYEDVNEKIEYLYKQMVSKIQSKLDLNYQNLKYYKDKEFFKSSDYFCESYHQQLMMNIQSLLNKDKYIKTYQIGINTYKHQLETTSKDILNFKKIKIDKVNNNLDYQKERIIKDNKNLIANISSKLDALSPLKVLGRGYSVVSKDNKAIINSNELKSNDSIKIRFAKGSVDAVVKK